MTDPRTLPPATRTLPALLDLRAEQFGDKLLVRSAETTRTYSEFRDAVSERASGLAAAGVGTGDRVAVMSENRLELLEIWFACGWLGAEFVPINTAFRGQQLAHILSDANPRLLVLEEGLVAHLECVLPPSGLLSAWLFDGGPREWGSRRLSVLPPPPGSLEPVMLEPGDASAILYTSGTTGPSKGVLCPQGQWFWWGVTTGGVLGIREDDILYTCLPLFHTNALNAFMQALVAGATYVIGPRFSASAFWSRVADSEATVTYLLGTMVHILLKREPETTDRAHHLRVALSPATSARHVVAFEDRFGVRLVDGWGSTETNCVLATTAGAPVGSMGKIVPGYTARVVDQNDDEVPRGTSGELVVRADLPFAFASGYLNLPEATVAAWRNLWFHTGDRVLQDADGWFWFLDRLKDSIRRRGENISSYEVESVLTAHPAVTAAAVVPTRSELGEDDVLAFLVLRRDAVVEPLELIQFCEPRLAYFAIPRFIEYVDQLPLTAGGKVEKYRLRELGVQPTTWDREQAGYEVRR